MGYYIPNLRNSQKNNSFKRSHWLRFFFDFYFFPLWSSQVRHVWKDSVAHRAIEKYLMC